MTLSQLFLWLSLCFPIWTMRWMGQLISKSSPTLTPCPQRPKRWLASLRKDILLKWLKHQERFSFLGYKHIRPETAPLRSWGWQGRWSDHPCGKPDKNLPHSSTSKASFPTMFQYVHKWSYYWRTIKEKKYQNKDACQLTRTSLFKFAFGSENTPFPLHPLGWDFAKDSLENTM